MKIQRQRRYVTRSFSMPRDVSEYINALGIARKANGASEALQIMANEHKIFCAKVELIQQLPEINITDESALQPEPTAAAVN